MELAKCKIDIMSLNSQLLDAIEQKLNLSQQLEAWQVRLNSYRDSILSDINYYSWLKLKREWCNHEKTPQDHKIV